MKKETLNLFDIKWLTADSKQGFLLLDCLNREIKPHQVSKLAESVDKIGIIRPVVVAELIYKGKKGLYIVDGQHLYFALLRHNLPIPYRIITVSDDTDLVEKLALMNNSSKSWTLIDYIQAWSYIQSDYKVLVKYFNTYDLELSTLGNILYGKIDNISRLIKTGNFKIKNEENAVKIMDCTTDLLKVLPRQDRGTNRQLVNGYITFLYNNDKYNHKKFMISIKKNIKKLENINLSSDNIADIFSDLSTD